MGRVLNGFIFLVVAGLVVAILREFGWDPFAAAEWAFSKVWATINHVADLWSNNETFREVTEKPS